MSELSEEEIARVVRQAMLSNPDGGPFRHRETERSLIASEAARLVLALLHPALERARVEERERAVLACEDQMPATQDMESTEICEALERAAAAIRKG